MLEPSQFSFGLASLPTIVVATGLIVLGVIVVGNERRTSASVAFLILTIAVGLALITRSIAQAAVSDSVAFAWEKISYLAVPVIPAASYYFAVTILGIYPRRRRVVVGLWIVGFFLGRLTFGTNAIFDSLYHYWFGYYVKYLWPAIPFLIAFFIPMVLSVLESWQAYRSAVPGTIFRKQVRSFLIAFSIGALAAVDYLPALGVPVYPFGFIFVALFIVLIARALWLYQVVDITPSVAAHEILALMSDAVLAIDQEGIVRLVNQAACALLEAAEEQLVGQPISATARGSLIAPYLSSALLGSAIQNQEIQIEPTDDTTALTLSLSMTIIKDRRERPAAVVCVARDVSERVLRDAQIRRQANDLQIAYDALQRTQTQVIQQERLYALGTMASGIAHDLNNALTPILGYSELLLFQPKLLQNAESTRQFLQMINDGASNAAKVLSRLRDFYRPVGHTDDHSALDLNDIVERTIALTRPRWHDQALLRGRVITIQSDLEPGAKIGGASGELSEVLTNLIFNAVDAIPADGTITLRTYTRDDRVILEVRDTGVGMTEEVRQHCFDPFYTTKGAQGSGLGLSVVYGSVRRHGGTIDIESSPGRGTTFRLSFPSAKTLHGTAPSPETLVKPRRVLIIDDDAPVRDVVARYLRADGHVVDEASEGSAGLAAFDSARYDLVITDRGMPGLGGDRVATAIKERSSATPIIMLTGYGDMMLAAGEHPDGVDLILSKPVTIQALRDALAELTTPSPPSRNRGPLKERDAVSVKRDA
jgi:PAS domain S-box-containing protein